jgi:hypothetical protein
MRTGADHLINPMFEGYLDRSAKANRKGCDASRALCICRCGKDVPYWQCLHGGQSSSTQTRQETRTTGETKHLDASCGAKDGARAGGRCPEAERRRDLAEADKLSALRDAQEVEEVGLARGVSQVAS